MATICAISIMMSSFMCVMGTLINKSLYQQIQPNSSENRNLFHDVMVIQDGSERRATFSATSPKHVLRSMVRVLLYMNVVEVTILTERKFYIIAKEWCREMHLLDNTLLCGITYNQTYHYLPKEASTNIVLLTPNKLTTLFPGKEISELLPRNHFMSSQFFIIGKCCFMPNFVTQCGQKQIPMVIGIPVDSRKWIHGIVKLGKAVMLYSTYRADRILKSVAIHKVPSKKTWENDLYANERIYGILQNVSIYCKYYDSKPEFKDSKLSGINDYIMEYIKDYMKFDLFLDSADQNSCYEFYPQFYLTEIQIQSDRRYKMYDYWPEIYRDVISIFYKTVPWQMTIGRLLSYFQFHVWLVVISIMITFNICFFVAFDISPSLSHHPKAKKRMNILIRILTFDSLIRFHMEWQQGPSSPVRWFLAALNIFLFFISNAYLILFSTEIILHGEMSSRILSDLCHFPKLVHLYGATYSAEFHKKYDKCSGREYGFGDNPQVKSVIDMKAQHTYECLSNGSCIFVSFRTYAKQFMQPLGRIVEGFQFGVNVVPISMASPRTFQFNHLFHRMIHRFREVGILRMLHKRVLGITVPLPHMPFPIDLPEIYTFFVIMGTGIFLASVVLIFETQLVQWTFVRIFKMVFSKF